MLFIDIGVLIFLPHHLKVPKGNGMPLTGCVQTGKSGKVREFEKNVVPGQEKSGKMFLSKCFIRVRN